MLEPVSYRGTSMYYVSTKRGGGVSQMLTFAYVGGGEGGDPCLRNHILYFFCVYMAWFFIENLLEFVTS